MFIVGLGFKLSLLYVFSLGHCEFGGQYQCSWLPGKTCDERLIICWVGRYTLLTV